MSAGKLYEKLRQPDQLKGIQVDSKVGMLECWTHSAEKVV